MSDFKGRHFRGEIVLWGPGTWIAVKVRREERVTTSREPCAGHREVSCEVSAARAGTVETWSSYQRPKATLTARFREGARARRLRTQARTVHAGDRGLQSAPVVVPGPRKRGDSPNR